MKKLLLVLLVPVLLGCSSKEEHTSCKETSTKKFLGITLSKSETYYCDNSEPSLTFLEQDSYRFRIKHTPPDVKILDIQIEPITSPYEQSQENSSEGIRR